MHSLARYTPHIGIQALLEALRNRTRGRDASDRETASYTFPSVLVRPGIDPFPSRRRSIWQPSNRPRSHPGSIRSLHRVRWYLLVSSLQAPHIESSWSAARWEAALLGGSTVAEDASRGHNHWIRRHHCRRPAAIYPPRRLLRRAPRKCTKSRVGRSRSWSTRAGTTRWWNCQQRGSSARSQARPAKHTSRDHGET